MELEIYFTELSSSFFGLEIFLNHIKVQSKEGNPHMDSVCVCVCVKFNNVQFDKFFDNLTIGLHVLNLHFL